MIESILDAVAAGRPLDRDCLSYASYNGHNFVTVLVYAAGEPLVVCQFARHSDDALASEYANLRRVAGLTVGDDWLRETTERVLTVRRVGETPVLCKRFLPGVKAGNLPTADPALVSAVFASATRWLSRLAAVSDHLRVYDPASKRRVLTKLTGRPTDRVEAFVGDDDLFLGPMHGDFAPGNVLLGDDGRVTGVVDFEWFTPHGVPLFDFVHLLVTLGGLLYASARTTVEELFFTESEVTDTVATCLADLRATMDLSRSSVRRAVRLYPDIRSGWGHEPSAVDERLASELDERMADVVWA